MSATTIARVFAWEALDSRGTPTVGCSVTLGGGAEGVAVVPSGASTGAHEAHELRDGDARYGGRGVRRAVRNVAEALAPAVIGRDAADQSGLDGALRAADGTPDLSRLGANAVLAVSVAAALAAARANGAPLYRWLGGDAPPLLPLPMINIVSGGAHAGRAHASDAHAGDTRAGDVHAGGARAGAVDIQDVLVVPVGAASFAEAIHWCWRVRRATAETVAARGLPAALVADEGGLGPALPSNRAALDLVLAGIERAGLAPGSEVAIAVDVAATQLAHGAGYRLAAEGRTLDAAGLLDELAAWCDTYPIVSLEDPLGEDDWAGWAAASRRWNERLQLLGDDLFVTDRDRLQSGVRASIANAVLVKPNQTGTLSDARSVAAAAHEAGYAVVVSARSGDTEDDWLADLAVGWRAGQIKVGSLARSERTAKWNRLLRIEAEERGRATFAGAAALGRNRPANERRSSGCCETAR